MHADELQRELARCRKKLLPSFIAWARGYCVGQEAIVTIRLTEGCCYEDIADVEEWLMAELEHKLGKGQAIDFFWQLMR